MDFADGKDLERRIMDLPTPVLVGVARIIDALRTVLRPEIVRECIEAAWEWVGVEPAPETGI